MVIKLLFLTSHFISFPQIKQFLHFHKLNSFGEANKKQRWLHVGETADPVTEEKLKQIQKEIQEQETLLQGYQQVWWFFST